MVELAIAKILGAALLATVLGFLWYHPRAFGTIWMQNARLTPEAVERAKKRTHLYAAAGFFANLIAAYVLYYVLISFDIATMGIAILVGFLAWIGFTAPALLGMIVWEQKPLAYYMVNALYWLVSLLLMSVTLAL